MKTRLKNELIRDWVDSLNIECNASIENYNDVLNRLINGQDPGPITIHIIDYEYNKLINATFVFSDTYPFKPPEVMINNTYNYKRLIGTINTSLVKKTLGLECLCCSSILCKWGASFCLTSIVNEISRNLNLKLRSSSINVGHLFTMNVFGHYLPIEEFL
tara:strand:- start:1294 stop:1773 length:480 start_codon:yes stop_codon:yes gene_type:complete